MFVKRFMPLFDADDQTGGGQVEEQVTQQPNDDQPKKLELTQEEFDEKITSRIKRAVSKYSDYDALKEKLSAYEKAEQEKADAELTELDRIKKELEAKSEVEQSLTQQIEDLKKAGEQEKITNAFIKAATSENIAYLDDALRLADLSSVSVEDGKVVGVEDVVKALVEEKPFLIAQKPKPIGQSTNSGTDKIDKTPDQLIKEAEEKARKSGRTEDRAAVAQLKRQLRK
ncbi:Clp protease ClpB [Bacillus safensis]|uniref:phage scaffolding protein n=1 Tax=Bacillus safensis TaxID=561879 RepID=UPI00227EB1CC|nr:Clp protease ClpB [Bacillus safensis]MCY7711306.1 Clp protease ClpB [Bacillus safensis]MCY7726434.1 Clp protease ClpB [Bacillus safensis]MED0883233.1 Clp protease ClpB [Bacillus safensis]MED0918519.1 Clp protease ClpB [Bacillus safensis]